MSDPIKYVIVSLKTNLSYLPSFDIPEYAAIPFTAHDVKVLYEKQNVISRLNFDYAALGWEAVLFSAPSPFQDTDRNLLLDHAEKHGDIITYVDFSEDALIKAGAKVIEAWEVKLQIHHAYGPVNLYAELDDDASTPILFQDFTLEELLEAFTTL